MNPSTPERDVFFDNLLVRIHFIIEMIWWTGLAPWQAGPSQRHPRKPDASAKTELQPHTSDTTDFISKHLNL